MKIFRSEKQLLYLFFLALVIIQVIFVFKNERVYEGTDNNTHFQIARYAFKYPQLFLDSWGKPVFTTLIAPFAQLGFKAVQLFNLALAVITLWFVFKIAKQIFPSGAIFTVVFTAFAPVYFLLMLTCLTEVLFSLFVVLAVYLFMKNKLLFSAIILSFIPFVRSEGIVLFPIFTLAFVLKRSYYPILFLLTGTLFYSIIGSFALGDFFWIINRFPYPTGESVYGSGELLHFIKSSNFIFGVPLLVLIVFGLFIWISEILRNFNVRNQTTILFILIAGSWITYFAAHSFVWWKGMGGSLGLIRVIGAVIPLAALTGVKATEFIWVNIRNRKLAWSVFGILAALQIFMFFNRYEFPLKSESVEKLIKTSSEYVKQNFQENKIYYFNPDICVHLGRDPYDKNECSWGVGDKLQPSNSMNFGDILIWDAHFGPNEGRVSFAALENDIYLEKIQTFIPLEKITVLGGYDYAIHIYQKVEKRSSVLSSNTLIRGLEINPNNSQQVISMDGENVFELQKGNAYSPNIVVYVQELEKKNVFETQLKIEFKSDEIINEKEVLLVISVEDGKENLKYEGFQITWDSADNDWKTVSVNTRFPAQIPDSAIIKMYVWNRGKKHVFIKKMESMTTSY